MRARRPARGTGQALVEFALVLPIFLLIVFGVFELGRAVFAYNTVANAAREGARVAAVNQIVSSPDCNESKPVEDRTMRTGRSRPAPPTARYRWASALGRHRRL